MQKSKLSEVLAEKTGAGELLEKLPDGVLRCLACGHRCPIPEGHAGVCRVRFNRGGELRVPFGYVAGLQDDPIEKKPFFHVFPGSRALSFGMLGCDLHCAYCQNWITSQALRDPEAVVAPTEVSAENLVRAGVRRGCRSIISTYNEPLITSEWAVTVFREAKQAGLMTGFVSNGNATEEVLDYLQPWIDCYKVDLKSFDDRKYRELGAPLERVCDSIRSIYRRGIWLEVVTLLVPGFNDSEEEIGELTGFLASVSPEIPWHVTAFHPEYKMADGRPAGEELLKRAAAQGKKAGLKYVYCGNLPGKIARGEDTLCAECGVTLIRREGFRVIDDKLTASRGSCPDCGYSVPGRWQ